MTSPLHQLLERVRQENRLPDILGEQCVHAFLGNASCRACIDACPQDAWILSEESLGLDTEACDGCSLCAPVCPEGAIISHGHAIALREWQGQQVAFCCCEYVKQEPCEGIIPCINAIGLQDILQLLKKGVQQLVVATENCAQCERGTKNRLSERLTMLNDALLKMHCGGIDLISRPMSDWQKQLNEESTSPAGPAVDRRSFLRSFSSTDFDVKNIVQKTIQTDQYMLGNTPFVPPAQLIPNPSAQTVWPNLPQIDGRLCDGCDACARLCPHDAIVLDQAEDKTDYEAGRGTSYRLEPANCTGCFICVDVCEQSAVSVKHWEKQHQYVLGLNSARCTACGTQFHLPAEHALSNSSLCQVCSQINHYKNLHQVLN